MANRGRPTNDQRKARQHKTAITYEELHEQLTDADVFTIHYDGICRRGHWYEDHMLKLFSGAKLVRLAANEYQVVEFGPGRRGGEGGAVIETAADEH